MQNAKEPQRHQESDFDGLTTRERIPVEVSKRQLDNDRENVMSKKQNENR
jgi:hypothetical protein